MNSSTPYSSYYGEYAASLEGLIQVKLDRKLTTAESNALRNAGSMMLLDDLDKRFHAAESNEQVEHLLQSCIALFQERYELGMRQIQEESQRVLARELRVDEVAQLKTLKNLHEIMVAIERIQQGKRDIGAISGSLND